jgi:opacity protein-like surface antigen
MKPARSLALALALSGLGATGAVAQYGGTPGYPSTGRYSAPALLPLPEASGPWVKQTTSRERPAAQSSTSYVAPVANYVPQPAGRPVVTAASQNQPSLTPSSSSLSPDLSFTAIEQPSPPALPPSEPQPGPSPEPLMTAPGTAPGMMAPNAYDVAGGNGCGCAGSGCWAGDCGVQCGHTWYGYVGGLYMGRDRSNKFWTTFETGNNANQLMYFPGADFGGGFETTIGFTWSGCGDGFGNLGCTNSCSDCNSCCSPYRHGIEATYWGVWGLDAEDSRRSETNQLSTPIDLGFVNIPTPGLPASVFFDNAREHRLRRDGEVHNVEINLVDFITPMHGRDVTYQWLVGARFFKFDEFLQFASVSSGNEFGSDAGLNEASLDLDIENNLIGAQIGGRADWRVTRAWRLFAGTKVGVYANDINFDTRLSRGDGALATFETTGNAFDLHAHETDVSLLAQLDLGVAWDFSRNWSANIGYRAVGVSGLALADDQLPAFLAAEQDWTDIDSNGSMILHGGFAGLEFRY